MLSRLLLIMMLLGMLQSGGEVLAADQDADERTRPTSVQLACLKSPSLLDAVNPGSTPPHWRHDLVLSNRDEKLWVARLAGQPVAAAIVSPVGPHKAGIALRCDDRRHSHAIIDRLMGAVLDACRERGVLKVVVETAGTSEEVRASEEKSGFMLSRELAADSGLSMEFYANLYFSPHTDRHSAIARRC